MVPGTEKGILVGKWRHSAVLPTTPFWKHQLGTARAKVASWSRDAPNDSNRMEESQASWGGGWEKALTLDKGKGLSGWAPGVIAPPCPEPDVAGSRSGGAAWAVLQVQPRAVLQVHPRAPPRVSTRSLRRPGYQSPVGWTDGTFWKGKGPRKGIQH